MFNRLFSAVFGVVGLLFILVVFSVSVTAMYLTNTNNAVTWLTARGYWVSAEGETWSGTSLIPSVNNTYTVGNTTRQWASGWFNILRSVTGVFTTINATQLTATTANVSTLNAQTVNITGNLTAANISVPTKAGATIVIAAYNAPSDVKQRADYVATGSGDMATILAALNRGGATLSGNPLNGFWTRIVLTPGIFADSQFVFPPMQNVFIDASAAELHSTGTGNTVVLNSTMNVEIRLGLIDSGATGNNSALLIKPEGVLPGDNTTKSTTATTIVLSGISKNTVLNDGWAITIDASLAPIDGLRISTDEVGAYGNLTRSVGTNSTNNIDIDILHTSVYGVSLSSAWNDTNRLGIDGKNIAGVRVSHSANQNIPTSTNATVAFNTEIYDTIAINDNTQTLQMHNHVGANNSQIKFVIPGYYNVGFNVAFNASGNNTIRSAYLLLNGTTQIGSVSAVATTTGNTTLILSTVYRFNAGDYIEVVVWQDSGATLAFAKDGANYPIFYAQRIWY